jgi:hypothetical protein
MGDGTDGPFVLVDVNCRSARAVPSIPFFRSHLNCLLVHIRTTKSKPVQADRFSSGTLFR